MTETFWKLTKFGATGISGMVIDFGITWLCREHFKWNKYIASTLGFIFAATTNYIINRVWTFESTNPQWQAEFSKFLLFSLAGLALNNFFIYLFHGKLKLNFYGAKFIATGLVFIWNFTVNFFFNFK